MNDITKKTDESKGLIKVRTPRGVAIASGPNVEEIKKNDEYLLFKDALHLYFGSDSRLPRYLNFINTNKPGVNIVKPDDVIPIPFNFIHAKFKQWIKEKYIPEHPGDIPTRQIYSGGRLEYRYSVVSEFLEKELKAVIDAYIQENTTEDDEE